MSSPVVRKFPLVFLIRTRIGYNCQWTDVFFGFTVRKQLVLQLPVVAVYDKPEVAQDGCKSTI
jgi:hypothetical protein